MRLGLTDAVADTRLLMDTVAGLLPAEAREGPRPHRRGTGRHAPLGVTVRVLPAPAGAPRSARASLATGAVSVVNRMSRALGRGSGTVAGGRVGLLVDPGLLATSAAGRRVVLVTGTNGKTTTTRLLAAALSDPAGGAVVSNDTGANMPAGHVAALVGAPDAPVAVLEVDEGYLGRCITETAPEVVVLLNLSRDQLDRIAEVRMLVDRWRTALGALASSGTGDVATLVVANADDPMVAWAAAPAPEVRWVGAGQVWHDDAVGCPACGGRIEFAGDGAWACDRCDFARPEVAADVVGDEAGPGRRVPAPAGHRTPRPVQPGQRGDGGRGGRRRDRPAGRGRPGDRPRSARRRHRGGRAVLDDHPVGPSRPTAVGQEPRRMDGDLRPLGRDG